MIPPIHATVLSLVVLAFAACSPAQENPMKPGYKDTPKLPNSEWCVHDSDRPHPPVVTPPVASTQDEAGKPPSDAVVLFSGSKDDLAKWSGRDGDAKWKVVDGAMEVNGTGDIESKEHFGDCQVHVEWKTPTPAKGESQRRGNSGVFLMGRYEIQVLDSYENVTYADGQAAAHLRPVSAAGQRVPQARRMADLRHRVRGAEVQGRQARRAGLRHGVPQRRPRAPAPATDRRDRAPRAGEVPRRIRRRVRSSCRTTAIRCSSATSGCGGSDRVRWGEDGQPAASHPATASAIRTSALPAASAKASGVVSVSFSCSPNARYRVGPLKPSR